MKNHLTYRTVLIYIFLFFVSKNPVLAQSRGESSLTFAYNIAVPMGSFSDFIGNATGRAFSGNILFGINNNWAAGLKIGYANFYEKKTRQVYKSDDGSDISAVVSNSVHFFPIMAEGKYNFKPGETIQPFVALGLGIGIINLEQYAGEFTNINQTPVTFTAQPEVGIHIAFNNQNGSGIKLSIGYNFVPYNDFGIDNFNHGIAALAISIPARR